MYFQFKTYCVLIQENKIESLIIYNAWIRQITSIDGWYRQFYVFFLESVRPRVGLGFLKTEDHPGHLWKAVMADIPNQC